jgi:hypothetical protein
MWFFYLILDAVVLFVFYMVFNERIKKNSGLTDVVKKYRQEIDSVTLDFNKTSFDNITLLEEKLTELKELMKLVSTKTEEYRLLKDEIGRKGVPGSKEGETGSKLYYVDAAQSQGRRNSKPDLVAKYFHTGESVQDISRRLDISEDEVKYYLKRQELG